MSPDTLQIDSTLLTSFQADSRFDYDREVVGGSKTLLEWLQEQFFYWLENAYDTLTDSEIVRGILIVLGIALIILLAWVIWWKKPRLFFRKEKKEALDYEVEEDTIYGVDFEADIRQALNQRDYRQAVRLLYLQTLKHLSDTKRIEWQHSRTPVQYTREYPHPAFAELSRHFVRVRYGNFEATEVLFQTMKDLQTTLWQEEKKGGEQP